LQRLHSLEQNINVNVSGFSQPMMQHMMNNHDQQTMGSSFHPQHQHQHQHPLNHHVMNGGMPVQVGWMRLHFFAITLSLISCCFAPQNQMVNQGQQNHIDSPANMLQQQHSYEVSFFFVRFSVLLLLILN